jgi:hypothetical protein
MGNFQKPDDFSFFVPVLAAEGAMRPRLGGATAAVAGPCCEREKKYCQNGDYRCIRIPAV